MLLRHRSERPVVLSRNVSNRRFRYYGGVSTAGFDGCLDALRLNGLVHGRFPSLLLHVAFRIEQSACFDERRYL